MISRNVAIGAGVLAVAGLSAVAHYSSTTRADQSAAVAPATPVPGSYLDPVAPAPVAVVPPAQAFAGSGASAVAVPVAAAPVRERIVYRTVAARPRYYVHRRSKKHSAEIIGGSAIGGAGIGALVGGKKGALIGGLVGGAAGTVYDRTTHKKVVRQ